MAKKERNQLKKENWRSQFTLIGEAKINDEYTYTLEKKSDGSDYIYNKLNIGVDCGPTCGVIYAEMMGGYNKEKHTPIKVKGKKEDGTMDTNLQIEIAWADRKNEKILEQVHDSQFITVGLEKDSNEKTFANKFISPYDAILYIKEHLKTGMVINVKGKVEYSRYNDTTQVKKKINSIFLSNADDISKYDAKITQTVLMDKDSQGKLDKDRGTIGLNCYVLDYTKMWGNKEVKTIVPLMKNFEFQVDMESQNKMEFIVKEVLTVKKDITEVTFEGRFIEGGAVIKMKFEDLPEAIQLYVENGFLSLEKALADCSINTGKERRIVFFGPVLNKPRNEGDIPTIMRTERKYTADDLILDFMTESEPPTQDDDDIPFVPDNKVEQNDTNTTTTPSANVSTTDAKVNKDVTSDDNTPADDNDWMAELGI